jgi:sugar phosphate isomerase/epimerase
MHLAHPEHPGRSVRLAYCMNLHGGETLEELHTGLREITLPLRARFGAVERFGVGMYFSGALAKLLAAPSGAADLARLRAVLEEARLDPFTYNAFPFGGFHEAGLKERVFEPVWSSRERLDYTLDVAHIAAALQPASAGVVTISTHPGRFGAFAPGELRSAAVHLGEALAELARLRAAGGPRIVLSIEAEPRAAAGTTREASALIAQLREQLSGSLGEEVLDEHLGLCLDACHAAVEFEEPEEAVALALGAGLGKLQFSSALSLPQPAQHPSARAALFALDEPRYLHQTTGRRGAALLRADDLPEVARLSESESEWLESEEWRTHFHVPVDLEELGAEGLRTTRAHADALLGELLSRPERWGGAELQVELEPYTWDILPGPARGAGELVDGLEREYAHVLRVLAAAGWQPRA